MRMLNYSSLFSDCCDKSFNEEILPHLHYYLNLSGICYYITGSYGIYFKNFIYFTHFMTLQVSNTTNKQKLSNTGVPL
jgi:hypothetical protein